MNAQHQWELKPQPHIYLQLAAELRGLGNASCGPGPMQKYTIDGNKPITFSFKVRGCPFLDSRTTCILMVLPPLFTFPALTLSIAA